MRGQKPRCVADPNVARDIARDNIAHMPYAAIPTTHIKDADLREFFQRANDYLADVYSMLSSRPLARTKGGGCNLTATLVLLCVVDAIATHVWPKTPTSGKGAQQARFEALIMKELHWEPQSTVWMRKEDAATLLYLECRNTLTHELGRDSRKTFQQAGFVEPTVGVWGNVRPKGRMSSIDARKKWPDAWPILSVLTDARGTRYKLTVVALYWAVKDMVSRMAAAA
jgi:hypothetical protein